VNFLSGFRLSSKTPNGGPVKSEDRFGHEIGLSPCDPLEHGHADGKSVRDLVQNF
jgi:hypothetical protein